MKKIAILVLAMLLSACATQSESTQSVQETYVQACVAYGAAFGTAVALRKAGKLNAPQIAQITLVDDEVTPICTGTLPADPDAATQQITAAVTRLVILEASQP